MNKPCQFAICALSALLPASIALGQQDYIGRYDGYTAYMYLNSPLLGLGENGFHTQVGINPTKWYSMGFDFSAGSGDTVLVPSMLKPSVQQAIASELAGLVPPSYHPAVPLHSASQTYAAGPQLNYRHFKAVTLFIHPDLGAIHETATPTPYAGDLIGKLLVANMAPSGSMADWTYFYGIGGGVDFNVTRHFGARIHIDFVRDHLFDNLLPARNSVRVSVGPAFHFGRNMAAAK